MITQQHNKTIKTESTPSVIGLAGRKRSGKTMMAKACRDNLGYTIVSLADPLKNITREILNISAEELAEMKDNGTTFDPPYKQTADVLSETLPFKRDEITRLLSDKPLGSVRDMLQTIGTDVIRFLDPYWHTKKTMDTIRELRKNRKNVVVDDVRFPNERYMIEQRFGGVVYFIVRPSCADISNHWSERQLSWPMFGFNYTILNIYGKDTMNEEFLRLIKGHRSGNADITYAEYDANASQHHTIGQLLMGMSKNDENHELTIAIAENNEYDKYGYVCPTGGIQENAVSNPLIIENHKLHAREHEKDKENENAHRRT